MLRKLGSAYLKQVSIRSTLGKAFFKTDKDIPIIDGLRGLSILLIILFHCLYGVFYLLKDHGRIQAFVDGIPPYLAFMATGDKAVDIFFLVSGFLLGMSLLRDFRWKGKIDFREFYLKRLFRIYPLFLLAILLYSPANISRSLKNLPYNLIFIDNFFGKSIIPVGWSLSIEMQFYFLLPFFVLLIQKLDQRYRFMAISCAFILSFFARWAICLANPVIFQTPFIKFHPQFVDPKIFMESMYYPTQGRFGPLFLGVMLAYLSVNKDLIRWPRMLLNPFSKIHHLLLILAIFCLYGGTQFPVYQSFAALNQNFDPSLNLLGHVVHRNLFSLGFFVLLLQTLVLKPQLYPVKVIGRLLSIPFWRPFSQAVFPMYLFHFPFIALAGLAVFGTTKVKEIVNISLTDVGLIFLLATLMTFGFSMVLHIFLEKPLMKVGYKWAAQKQSSQAVATPGS